ncbi:GspE/PulE family protein [Alkalilimnicola sp. S0819]|uniref:GspE/PulE family protein n=1 Tax=Alkalilimnicola sp. S0819 TaxID=2613922 RepID=UPI0012629074|nr:GspE/PulE family protein [Alkalilimnicola sp. S0819]KAB7623159.1 type II/IV secretion system protein [Alkalilimnicola sp. S0819]MPQ17003.1 type II/IV secretion system protein [Alkalilimnicola sp. S0819]
MAAAPTGRLTVEALLAQLAEDGLLDEDQRRLWSSHGKDPGTEHPLVQFARREAPDPERPGRTLDLERLSTWLAARHGLPHVRIDPLAIDVAEVAGVVSYAYASRFRILPIQVEADSVTIASADPWSGEWREELERILGKTVKPVMANPADIDRFLVEFYSLARSMRGAKTQQGRDSGLQNLEQLRELGRRGELEANDGHVVSVVDWLLQYAMEQRASDIHMEPRREQGNVRFRIDGVLHQVYEIPAAVMGAVTSRLKILARMDVAEKRRPQDGRLKIRSVQGREVEFRLSTMPSVFGEKLVLRIFDPDALVLDLAQLGFSQQENAQWQELIHAPNGIVLVTGPTGSGKTTTLYSSLRQLAGPEVNVSSVEDPVELVEPSFNQMQVQRNIGLNFADGIRTLLRQDPDIIMVGEIRDLETAEMAVQAAQTGHLVLSTLHTNDAPSAIVRLLDLGLPAYLIRSSLLGVLAQRLVRTLCPHCRKPEAVEREAWQKLVAPWKAEPPAQIRRATGCLECRRTGYKGRTGLYELLRITPALRELITAEADLPALRAQAIKEGLRPMRLSGARKIAQGVTDIDEVIKVTPPPHEA